MYVLYELATGRAHSESSEPITNPNDDFYGVKQTDKSGLWNPDTLDFDPPPINKRITTLSFMDLFSDGELIKILDAAKVNTQIQLFVMKIEQAEFIDLGYEATINGVNALETAGLIEAGRAAVILNG